MTTCGYLTINTPASMERRPVHGGHQPPPSSSSRTAAPVAAGAGGIRVITDNGVESEATSRSPYDSQSTMSSSYTSGTGTSFESHAAMRQAQAAQESQRQQPLQRRVAVRDGEITGSSIPSTAIVRRKPLHQTLGENSDDNFEVALSWHRNKRILLGRLM